MLNPLRTQAHTRTISLLKTFKWISIETKFNFDSNHMKTQSSFVSPLLTQALSFVALFFTCFSSIFFLSLVAVVVVSLVDGGLGLGVFFLTFFKHNNRINNNKNLRPKSNDSKETEQKIECEKRVFVVVVVVVVVERRVINII